MISEYENKVEFWVLFITTVNNDFVSKTITKDWVKVLLNYFEQGGLFDRI